MSNVGMKKTWNFSVAVIFVLVASLGGTQVATAQEPLDNHLPPPSSCLPTDPDYDPRLCVPIDGGLAFLLAAGIGYGIIKNRPSRKRKDAQPA